MKKKLKNRMKGQNLSIRTMALIVLGILMVVLVYGAFSGWFNDIAGTFVGNIEYPTVDS